MAQCEFIKPDDGERCQSPSLTDDIYCLWHSSKYRAKAQAARRKGGRNRAGLKDRLEPIIFDGQEARIKSVGDLIGFLNVVIDRVTTGKLAADRAKILLAAAKELRAIFLDEHVARQMEELESKIARLHEVSRR